jgi:hypothetical protein
MAAVMKVSKNLIGMAVSLRINESGMAQKISGVKLPRVTRLSKPTNRVVGLEAGQVIQGNEEIR